MKDAQDAVKDIREWPVQKYLIENEDGSIEFSDNKPGRVVCTREEFEAENESARMSGKPSWGSAPEGARILVQYTNGKWFFGTYESAEAHDSGWYGVGSGNWFNPTPGTVLGDWRDTLERRPEVSADIVPPAPMWMPPADSECEMLWTSPDEYYRVKIFGYDDYKAVGKWLDGPRAGELFVEAQSRHGPVDCPSLNFRPLKSDRERWVESALAQDCPPSQGMMSRTEFCEALYEALKSGELPMPEKD